jgi:hypothetical protein
MHPLVKQAAKYFATNLTSYVHLVHYTNDYPEGIYPFSIYAWSYMGIHPMFNVVPVCGNSNIEADLVELLQSADSTTTTISVRKETWAPLEARHVALWQTAKEKHLENVQAIANFRLESISSNFRNRKRTLEQKIRDAFDEKIIRMYQSELQSATENYNTKVAEINARASRADIHTTLVANGVIEIKKV